MRTVCRRIPHAFRASVAAGLLQATVAFAEPLDGTKPLTTDGDPSAQMVAGIDRWLDRETPRVAEQRKERWTIPPNDPAAREKFFTEKREVLRGILGAFDERRSGPFEVVTAVGSTGSLPDKPTITVERVRWPVFDDVNGEGLLLRPPGTPKAAVVALPDAAAGAFELIELPAAQRLAQAGCLVLVPVVVSRDDRWSGSERLDRFTNQPHREWIYRQAFEMGRTLIGYEVQKVQSAFDALRWLAPEVPLGVFGYGEGGLIALHTAALDTRITATLISGYFGPREALWQEPIYRNLFGFLREFGDAELAALVAPRRLLVEACAGPRVDGPPAVRERRAGAAPGRIAPPDDDAVRAEVARANRLIGGTSIAALFPKPKAPPGEEACDSFVADLGIARSHFQTGLDFRLTFGVQEVLQRRAVRDLEEHTQRLLRLSGAQRGKKLWSSLKPGPDFDAAQRELRGQLWENVIGKIPQDYLPPNPRTRPLPAHEKWTGYEVTLDVLPDVFAWGWLLVPKDLKPGERRPVVICQHGLEGLPEDTVSADPKNRGWNFYKAFASQLAARGFVVYAPHNPYRGKDAFRLLQRKANPLGLSLFSFIIAQHDVTTRWLTTLPFVDPERIAFYGLSYGGKTAMRVPAVLDRYCLSICSGDFNEWVGKNVSTEWGSNYPFTHEWEMPEWNMGGLASYAEMAMLIAPRPFMVERGHDDGVGLDQWVGYEWGKVRRGYDKLGISDRAEIEWFNGPHTIRGVGTFQFLHRHLGWEGDFRNQAPNSK
jgi:dienelactone hydrolase